jgi:hypothetical protein
MNYVKNLITLIFLGASFILLGCADKKSAAQIEDLKKELVALKSNSKTADDILILKNEIASLKEENEAAKKRQLVDGKTLQNLVDFLPITELALWKSAGLIECRQLTIKEANSASVATLTPAYIRLNQSSDSYVFIGTIGENQGVVAKSESGYSASLIVGKNESYFMNISPDQSFTQIFAQQDSGGFKSGNKDQMKQSIGLMRMKKNDEGVLYIKDPKNTLLAKGGSLHITKGNQTVFQIESSKRGAAMKFFDDVGDSAKIGLFLKDDNGEPVITVQGATKFDVLYPAIDKSK